MFTPVRVAASSFRPRKFDTAANAERLEALFRRAAAAGAQLAVAPEGALDGYVVMPIIDGAEPAERMHEAAVSIRGPEVARFRDLARELGMCLAFGLAERSGGDVYNCALFLDADGRIRGRYARCSSPRATTSRGGSTVSGPARGRSPRRSEGAAC